MADRRRQRNGDTVRDLAALYMLRHSKPRRRSSKDDRRRLDRYILPAPGDEIGRIDAESGAPNSTRVPMRRFIGLCGPQRPGRLNPEIPCHSKCLRMRYISLFSGMGGLESEDASPVLCCEMDPACASVLQTRYPGIDVHPDVTTLRPPTVDFVAGGWPCQDISVAGLRRGLEGKRSGLFFEMLRVSLDAGAHTMVAENVPNLLTMSRGAAFDLILRALYENGYQSVAWRTLDAREFGLPHERRRIFIVASQHREIAMAIHRPVPSLSVSDLSRDEPSSAGFYWTAGLHSICYSPGCVPTLKVGSSLSIPSPPAVHFGGVVRKVTSDECLRLQGFDPVEFEAVRTKDVYRMTGNAVAKPVGEFVMGSVDAGVTAEVKLEGFGYTAPSGFFDGTTKFVVRHERGPLATNLSAFLDLTNRAPLSQRAAAGLVNRLMRSGKPCPPDLLELLARIAGVDVSVADRNTGRKVAGAATSYEAGDEHGGALSLFG